LEKAKHQVSLLKQRVSYNTPPNSLYSMDLNLPSSFHTINDQTIRQHLFDRQQKIIQQTKTDMMAVLIQGAETKMRECQKKFDFEMTQLWQNYRSKSNDQHYLTKSMIDLIDERLLNVTERFQVIYNYKMKYFFFKAPTVNNNNQNIL
jgi:hypothetical protein